jgi:hypothetical protein
VRWPAKSPDVNCAEHVWAVMNSKVKVILSSHSSTHTLTRDELIAAVKRTAADMKQPQQAVMRRRFIDHVHIAMLECIAAAGRDPYKYHVHEADNKKQN